MSDVIAAIVGTKGIVWIMIGGLPEESYKELVETKGNKKNVFDP